MLPPYRVRARNLARYSANRIHDDAVARTYGFARGLVAGTTVYAYMTYPLVATWGLDWLERGTARVRFVRPVYDGDEVSVGATVVGRSGGSVAGEVALELEATTRREGTVATAVAGLAWGAPPVAPDPDDYPAASLPSAPPPAEGAVEGHSDLLAGLDRLGSPAFASTAAELAQYASEVDDPLEVYRGVAAVVHPGLLLQQANRALSENVTLGPWIHVESDLAHSGVARVGDRLVTRGRVARVFERRGRGYVELDLLVVADHRRPILHVRHTAIYRLPPGGPEPAASDVPRAEGRESEAGGRSRRDQKEGKHG